MKKYLIPVFLCLALSVLPAQGPQDIQYTQSATTTPPAAVPLLDSALGELAENIHRKLLDAKAQKISVGQFNYRGSAPPLSAYLINQLTGELANKAAKPYIILSGGTGADWTITGEIVDIAGSVIRVYARLIRSEDRSVEASFNSDFERTTAIAGMLAGGGSGSSSGDGGSSSAVDEYEPDSWENPVAYEIGIDENAPVISRSIQPSGDEDFFLLVPDRDGRIIVETTGNIDTYMEFYDADTHDLLDEDDDSGRNTNARIRYNVQAGKRYIALVRGYSGSTTGAYGFRAWIPAPREGQTSWNSPHQYEPGTNESATVINRRLESGDEEFFLLVPENEGRLTVETTGNVDTYIEFYDADTRNLLAEDDDSGSRANARIRYSAQAGKRYIAKVRGYDSDDVGNYGFRAWVQAIVRLAPDEYEPDDDPASAKTIEIGTPQQHTFHSGDDVDWVKFQITQSGRYTIRARGVNSNRLDTYIELFDANLNSIAEDDDGGESLDSLLSLQLGSGLYYLKVWCLDDEPDQPYTISINAE
ncbi:MAG: DVUA0089 family protein [Treponema sp.]|nr:DVUA0089 family protein [Treponema sp.]